MSDSTAVVAPGDLAARGHAAATTWRIWLRDGGTYLYLLPSLVFLALFTYYPIYDIPAMKEFVGKDPRYLVARDQLQFAAGKMMAPNFQKIREILKKQLDDSVDGRVSPKEAMVTVQKQVEAVIKR